MIPIFKGLKFFDEKDGVGAEGEGRGWRLRGGETDRRSLCKLCTARRQGSASPFVQRAAAHLSYLELG